jgi:hypothetical protein
MKMTSQRQIYSRSVIPAEAGIQDFGKLSVCTGAATWTPAFAGVTALTGSQELLIIYQQK